MKIRQMKSLVCQYNKLLLESNLVTWTSGNVSGADSKGYLYIKPSGVLFPDLEPEDISVVSINYGTHIEGKKPSTEYSSRTYQRWRGRQHCPDHHEKDSRWIPTTNVIFCLV